MHLKRKTVRLVSSCKSLELIQTKAACANVGGVNGAVAQGFDRRCLKGWRRGDTSFIQAEDIGRTHNICRRCQTVAMTWKRSQYRIYTKYMAYVPQCTVALVLGAVLELSSQGILEI